MKFRVLLLSFVGFTGAFTIPSFQFPQQQIQFTFSNDLNNLTTFKDGQKSFDELASNHSSPLSYIMNEVANFTNVSNYQEWFLPSDYRQLSDYYLNANLSLPYFVQDSLRSASEQYASALNSSLTQGFIQTQKSFTQLSEMAITAIQMSNNVVTMALVDFQTRLSRYRDNVRYCVEEKAGGYREVLPTARDVAVDCVFRKYRQGLSIILGTRNDTLEAIEGGRQLGDKINSCVTNSSSSVPCILAAIANINQKTILLPVQMTKRFGEASEYVATIKSDILNCGAKVIDVVAEQSLNVTQTIAVCLIPYSDD